ncbi:MAG: hypothetical protein ACE5JR_11465 [Gemmatimonadota bacterium]
MTGSGTTGRKMTAGSSLAVALLLVIPAVPSAVHAQIGPAHWRPDDRILIGDFSWVEALARGFDRLYAATGAGLVVYDDLSRRFEPPFTREDGYPEARVTAMTYDDRDGTLWLATDEPRLLQLQPDTWRFQAELGVSEELFELVPAEISNSDLFARTRRGWLRIDTFLREIRPVSPEVVAAEAARNSYLRRRADLLRDPGFQSVSSLIGRGSGARAAPLTDVMPGRGGSLYWVGTAGGFIVEYDHLTRTWSPLAFGFLGRGAAAFAADTTGVWFLPHESARGRFGVARADVELQRWQVWDVDSVRAAPQEPLRVAVSTRGILWAGGPSGLYRYAEEDGGWTDVGRAGVLRAREVTALAAEPGRGVWVGTSRGVILLSETGDPLGRSELSGVRVYALAVHAGRLWVGTSTGLYAIGLDGGGPEAVSGSGALRRRVGALAAEGEILYAGLGHEVWRWSEGSEWARVDPVGPVGGPVTALAVRDGVLWVGSDEGIVRWDPRAVELRRFSFAAGDLPTDRGLRGVYALLPMGPYEVWIGTPAGALRLKAE